MCVLAHSLQADLTYDHLSKLEAPGLLVIELAFVVTVQPVPCCDPLLDSLVFASPLCVKFDLDDGACGYI